MGDIIHQARVQAACHEIDCKGVCYMHIHPFSCSRALACYQRACQLITTPGATCICTFSHAVMHLLQNGKKSTVRLALARRARQVISWVAVSLSRPEVGSSSRMICGSVTSPIATLRRRRSPPLMPLMPCASSPANVCWHPSNSFRQKTTVKCGKGLTFWH